MVKLYLYVCRYLTVFLLCTVTTVFAQQTVTGKVIAEDGSAIPGVNILEKGTSNGTVSDANGSFSITIAAGAKLTFSFIGYATQEIAVGDQTTINVTLKTDVAALSEVVVIGYGEIKKKDATGAVVSVRSEDFQKGVISSPEQLIQGKAAGVQITSASGEPGAGVNVRIRGTSSMQLGNNPLFVVDGIPLTGDELLPASGDVGRGGGSGSKNPLNFINPSDIESVDVLKDASATAIYGSRGANGVVIIKTKSGKGLKRQFEYSSSISISSVAKKLDLLDRNGFLDGVAKFGGNAGPVASGGVDYGAKTDWQNEISRAAVSNRHSLSYADNIKDGNYRASFSYDNQQGVIKHSSLERITGRLNANYAFMQNKLKVGLQSTLSRVNDVAAPISNSAGFEGDLLGATYMANPTWNAYPDAQFSNTNANPNAMLKYYGDNTKTNRHLINLSAGYDIMEGLNFKINTGFDGTTSERSNAFSPALYLSNGVYGNGRGSYSKLETSSNLVEAFFTYDKELGPGTLNALLGYSFQQFNTENITVLGWGFSDPSLPNMMSSLKESNSIIQGALAGKSYQQYGLDGSGSSPTLFINQLFPTPQANVSVTPVPVTPVKSVAADTYKYTDKLQSFFARANYSLSGGKYIVTATIRSDGSSKFGGNNKYGMFPSAALAWKISQEEFAPKFFDDLKLRLGYGVTGNQNIPHNLYQQRERYGAISIQNGGQISAPGVSQTATDNPGLKWEQTSMINAGLDFAILKSKLKGTVDVYQKETTNMLIQSVSAQPAPTPFIYTNLDAKVINRGVELTLTYSAITNEKGALSFVINGAINDNMVKNLGSQIIKTGQINGQGLTGAYAQQIGNNQPLYAYFLRDFLGFDQLGNSIYGSSGSQIYVGKSPLPKANLGFTINARYKGWDFSAFFNGQFGYYIYNNTANALFTAGSLKNGRNVTTNVVYSGESPQNAPDVSTRFLEKGDYLRFQNLNLGHNFKLPAGSRVKSVRLGLSGQNLFVITSYSGRDPEVNVNRPLNNVPSASIDYTSYPRARVYTLNLSATF